MYHLNLSTSYEDIRLEVVERKGIGHPDTIADGVAELASAYYSAYCLDNFGIVLHHNFDKVAIFGGLARFNWNAFDYVKPVRVTFGGRVSTCFGSIQIPYRDILETAALEYLRNSLPGFEKTKFEFYHFTSASSKNPYWFEPRSKLDLPEYKCAKANDTAFVRSTAPFSRAERLAFEIEAALHHRPWAGSDIKVMVSRLATDVSVTICVPVLHGHAKNSDDYNSCILDAEIYSNAIVEREFHDAKSVAIKVNPHCARLNRGAEASAGYVNVSGSAIDYGEDGLVGRGNARTGLIQPMRGHGNEALFGKNPIYHVGKVYSLFADEISEVLASAGFQAHVAMLSSNGANLNFPSLVHIGTYPHAEYEFVEHAVKTVLNQTDWWTKTIREKHYVPKLKP